MMKRFLKNSARRLLYMMLGSQSFHAPLRNWYQYYFDRYKKERERQRPIDFSTFCPPYEPGLVSVVLPVYNGERHLAEAIKSILKQSYKNFELIIVNDGSTDSSPTIIEEFAKRDKRIKVIHQKNQKLPKSLSNGFRIARGEFLTWTSDDNRLKASCLEKLVSCLKRHPDWDMTYANMDIIGEDGKILKNSDWYCNYQVPPGSGHVHLPEDPHELNVWPNQYIGASFLYRAKVAALLRDYSPYRFTIEDYDYFMQINEFFKIRHADFTETIYEYRFHGTSLTSREKELQILKHREYLMVFDDFRRDFNLTPVWWIFDGDEKSTKIAELIANLKECANDCGDLIADYKRWSPESLPTLWFPCVYVKIASNRGELAAPPEEHLPINTTKVLVVLDDEALMSKDVDPAWDLCLAFNGASKVRTLLPYQGWHRVGKAEDILGASEILCRKKEFEALEREIFEPSKPMCRYSIVICTYKRTHILDRAISAAFEQDFPKDDFEIIVVNNDPDNELNEFIKDLQIRYPKEKYTSLRLVQCPFKGLSHARNAGISQARGEVVCFLDDDALPDSNWLKEIDRAYNQINDVGLVGGKILVKLPEKCPPWLEERALVYWSHFDPHYKDITITDNWWEFPWGANWTAKRQALLEIGGFRCRYGRKGNDFGGGEELLAGCLIHRLGYKVAINPKAVVTHHIDPDRLNKEHVKKTIKSALLVNYRLQTDLYMPRWMDAKEAARKTGSWTKDLITYFRLSPFKRLEVKSNIGAHLALLKLIAQDYKNRAKTPG